MRGVCTGGAGGQERARCADRFRRARAFELLDGVTPPPDGAAADAAPRWVEAGSLGPDRPPPEFKCVLKVLSLSSPSLYLSHSNAISISIYLYLSLYQPTYMPISERQGGRAREGRRVR